MIGYEFDLSQSKLDSGSFRNNGPVPHRITEVEQLTLGMVSTYRYISDHPSATSLLHSKLGCLVYSYMRTNMELSIFLDPKRPFWDYLKRARKFVCSWVSPRLFYDIAIGP